MGILIVLNSILFGLPFVYESFFNIILGLFVIVITFLSGREKHVVYRRQAKRREKTSEIYAETHPLAGEDAEAIYGTTSEYKPDETKISVE